MSVRMQLSNEVLRTLLYYDIWSFPLTERELFTFLPVNSMSFEQFQERLNAECKDDRILRYNGYFFARGNTPAAIQERTQRERHARRMWRFARLSTHIIKRFPFVRAVFVSGDLSKNATRRESDIDFFIVTEPHRLWIARWLLILFKKFFLLNKKKYFCLNSFITADSLSIEERNIYTATEIATLKPMYNAGLFEQILSANKWIREYFPNFSLQHLPMPRSNERQSFIQKVAELPFRLIDASRLDAFLMRQMESIWRKRYTGLSDAERHTLFRCTPNESRAYVGNFQEKILMLYSRRLADFEVTS